MDRGGNPLSGIGVTFAVVRGNGHLNGDQTLTQVTGADGIARAVLALGPDAGISNNVVNAAFEGLAGLPATFTSSGLVPGDPAQTSFSGVVLDDGHTAIAGAVVTIPGTDRKATTDAQGQFLLTGVPVGHIHLRIDPTGGPRPETFPPLEFETVTVAGQTNTLGQPILLPALDTESSQIVGGDQDVTLTMKGVAGLTLTVFKNSVTCPDGSHQCRVSISQVHLDKVPMPPPSGTIFMPSAWTIQPAGTLFNPPARITIPNDGLPPGRVIEIYQFDHALNQFIDVGKGTVSQDGFIITSDPGFGITRAGWGGCGQPPPPTSDNEGPDCPISDSQSPIKGGNVVPPSNPGENHGDGRYSPDGEFRRRRDGRPRPHMGVDISAPVGTPMHAVGRGTVVTRCPARACTQSGNQIVIDHGNGIFSRYFHLDSFDENVRVGDTVEPGQVIGRSGTTGNAAGTDAPHLHLEIRQGSATGTPLDPTGCI